MDSTIGILIKLLLWQIGQITRSLEMAVAVLSVVSALSFVPADDADDDAVLNDSTSSVNDKKIRSRSSGLNKGSRLESSSSSSITLLVMLALLSELVGTVTVLLAMVALMSIRPSFWLLVVVAAVILLLLLLSLLSLLLSLLLCVTGTKTVRISKDWPPEDSKTRVHTEMQDVRMRVGMI